MPDRHPGEETFLPTRLAADPRGLSHSTPSSSAGAGSPLIYGAGTAFYPLHAGAPDSGRHGLRHGNDFSNESYLYNDPHAIQHQPPPWQRVLYDLGQQSTTLHSQAALQHELLSRASSMPYEQFGQQADQLAQLIQQWHGRAQHT